MTNNELMARAKEARKRAYCPYSNFSVGAALLCTDGSIYLGCNIENSGYSATNCAERTAFFSAIADKKREFSAIAICGGKLSEDGVQCMPCGICRQVMSEFCDRDFLILVEDGKNDIKEIRLGELLPYAFSL